MFEYQAFDLAHFMRWQAEVTCQQHLSQPELAGAVSASHMNVGRFTAFVGVEVEPVRANAEDGRGEPGRFLSSSIDFAAFFQDLTVNQTKVRFLAT